MSEWQAWIDAVRAGDNQATHEFWTRYADPLIRLADKNLQQRLRRRVDPEDVVQSTFRTVLRRIQDGQFRLSDDDDLWRLMCAVTLNKSRRQHRRHGQQMRSMDQEVYFSTDSEKMPARSASGPSPEEATLLVDLVDHVVNSATDVEERRVLLYKLDDLTNEQIAERLARSERTVRRIVARLKERIEKLLDE